MKLTKSILLILTLSTLSMASTKVSEYEALVILNKTTSKVVTKFIDIENTQDEQKKEITELTKTVKLLENRLEKMFVKNIETTKNDVNSDVEIDDNINKFLAGQ
mgnify:CR=1 FL=1